MVYIPWHDSPDVCVLHSYWYSAATREGPWTRCSRRLFYWGFEFHCKTSQGKELLTSERSPFSQNSEVVKPHVHGRSGGDSWGCGTTWQFQLTTVIWSTAQCHQIYSKWAEASAPTQRALLDMVGAPEEAEGYRSTGQGIQSGTSMGFMSELWPFMKTHPKSLLSEFPGSFGTFSPGKWSRFHSSLTASSISVF